MDKLFIELAINILKAHEKFAVYLFMIGRRRQSVSYLVQQDDLES